VDQSALLIQEDQVGRAVRGQVDQSSLGLLEDQMVPFDRLCPFYPSSQFFLLALVALVDLLYQFLQVGQAVQVDQGPTPPFSSSSFSLVFRSTPQGLFHLP